MVEEFNRTSLLSRVVAHPTGCDGRAPCAPCVWFVAVLLGEMLSMVCTVLSETHPTAGAPFPPLRLSVVRPEAHPADEPEAAPQADWPPSDFPEPRIMGDQEQLIWDVGKPIAENATALGKRLAACGDLYRQPSYAAGLMLASQSPNILPETITKGKRLAAIIVDRFPVKVKEGDDEKGNSIPASQLEILLATEVFLQQFQAIDQVVTTPLYLPSFELTAPGYGDNGHGYRTLYVGENPRVEHGTDAIRKFLDVMAFATEADRTAAMAARLTVMLRNLFPGAKPMFIVTANKSHAGKDTAILFAAGRNRITSLSYQRTDWALERAFVGAVKHSPDTGVVSIENARLGAGEKVIASAFLERFLCDPEPTLFSTGSGGPLRRKNDLVIAASTNFGSFSTDALNRGLLCHLEVVGDVATRQSSIGNPKLEYLPAHVDDIEAECRGMMELWKREGCPRDTTVRHPFSEWAAVVGGILKANGFRDFLGNYAVRRTVDDPLREAIALLGTATAAEKEEKKQWLTPADWAGKAVDLGLVKRVIPRGDQDSPKGRERGIGIVLTAHNGETFHAVTDSERLVFRLERARRRFESGKVSTRYRFKVIERAKLPADDDGEVTDKLAEARAEAPVLERGTGHDS